MDRGISRGELRRSRHEREQAAMREAGIDPSSASAIGQPQSASESSFFAPPMTVKAVRNSRRRREAMAAAELGVDVPGDISGVLERTSSHTSQASIRRQRLRREHEIMQKLETEQRQREREELALERAAERAHKKAKREYLKRAREREGLGGNPASVWRRLTRWCTTSRARPRQEAAREEEAAEGADGPLKQELYRV